MKRPIFIILLVILILLGGWLTIHFLGYNKATKELKAAQKEREQQIEDLLDSRRATMEDSQAVDVFGDDGQVNILLIGLDSRLGETNGNCDAIQFISIDKTRSQIKITAIPRGTYAPLPGTDHKFTDYYISNACGLVSLEYGVEQIERILGQKADYIAVVGFSSTIGILRALDLPTIETLQWLRNRQTYAIGEPQRAHNHSSFLKQMLLKYSSGDQSKVNAVWQYLVYKMIQTDLSFDQVKSLVSTVTNMNLSDKNVQLHIKPYYQLADIEYDPDNLSQQLDPLQRLVHLLPAGDYSGETEAQYQNRLLKQIKSDLENSEFVTWAYNNFIWLQIEDDYTREYIHYDIMTHYIEQIDNHEQKQQLLAEYINEMDSRELPDWAEKGREYLAEIIKGNKHY